MKQKFASALSLALILAMLFTSVGLADNVVDNVTIGGTDTFTAPGSTTIGYKINANGGDGQSGCNASDGSPATVTLSVPAGVTASATSLVFNTCGVFQNVTFSSSKPGDYAINVLSISDSGAGSYKNEANFTLHVQGGADTTAPVIAAHADVTAEATSAAGVAVAYTSPATSDDVDGVGTATCSPASGAQFALGGTTVTCNATDAAGNVATPTTFKVIVLDTTPPVIAAHADVTAEATSSAGATVNYTNPATTDAVAGTGVATCSPASGNAFPLGNTTVTCNASDGAGNAATATTFVVHVVDTIVPIVTVPSNISQEATGPSGNVVTFMASATDTVDGNLPVTCTPASGSTFPIAATTVNCSATDSHNNTGSGSFSVTIADTTAPVIAAHDNVTAEATGPNGASVNYTAPATSDAVDGSGVATCSPASGSQFGLGNTTVTCTAKDAHNNAATPTIFVVKVVDTTPPTISYVGRTTANSNGWNNGDVTVNWSCSDTVGVPSPTVSVTVSTEGENQSAKGTCEDTSGNEASDTQNGINIDLTAPSASASRAPLANSFGWSNSDVTVSFSGTDNLSKIDFCSADQVFGEGTGQSASGTCTDKAGNVSAPAALSNINVDKTAPTASATASPAANSFGWNNTNVTVSFSGSDSLSGIDTCSDPVVLSSEGANQSTSGTCKDKAGNVSAPATKLISIDLTLPIVSLVGGPANGGNYYFGFVPAAPTCSASDGLSGLDGACSVDGYSNTIGGHTVTASARDKAGNLNSASASYTVNNWTLKGFYQPVDMNGTLNIVKGGSTVPLKFEVFATSELTDTTVVKSFVVTQVTCNTSAPIDDIELVTTGGTTLRYDTTGGQFIQNWQTPKPAGLCYKVTMTTQDGSSLSALFKTK